jgi:Carboxypeptidase regulatory-like domain/TonB dependent receptor/TonB-dependent Receptor Plug Domain
MKSRFKAHSTRTDSFCIFIRCALLFPIISLFAFAIQSQAQTITATISGTVRDQADAIIPKAKVIVIADSTGNSKSVMADDQGRYSLAFLQPGSYKLTVEVSGFKTLTRSGITLEVAQVLTLDHRLEVGQAQEIIQVTGDAPLLITESAGLESTIENQLIESLPSAQRSTLAFLNQTPGVIDGGIANAAGETLNLNGHAGGPIGSPGNRNFFDSSFSVGGGQSSTNDVLLDGVSNTLGDFNGVAVNPPPDSVREFKVLSGIFSAEYGRTGGGVVNMITKSGTKDFHGSLYEYFQNGALNANGWQRNRRGLLPNGEAVLPRIPIKRNQFGAAFGGPIWLPKKVFGPLGYKNPNQTFFFVNYEGRRERNPFSRELTLPTEKMRRGDLSELLTGATRPGQTDIGGSPSLFGQIYDPYGPLVGNRRRAFAGNRLDGLPVCGPGPRTSACFDPIALEILKYIPQPNVSGTINNFVFTDVVKFERDLLAVRIDHTISERHSFFGRLSKEARALVEPNFFSSLAANARTLDDDFYNFTFNDVYSLTPSLINNARYGYTRARAHQTPISEGFDPGRLGFPSYILDTAPIGAFPRLNFDAGAQGLGRASEITDGQIGGDGNNQPRDTQTIADTMTWLKGAHSVKFGGEYRLIRFFAFQFSNPAGTYDFSRAQTRGPNPAVQPANVLETGSSFASFLLGIPSGGSKQQVTPITVYHHYGAAFLQDDWKVARSLTLNLGVRWDYETGTAETHGLIPTFDMDAPSHLRGRVGAPADPIVNLLRPDFTDLRGLLSFPDGPQTEYPKTRFAPRIGVAWRLGEKTVLRGGYGLYFVPYTVEQSTAIGNVYNLSIQQGFNNNQVRQPGEAGVTTVFLTDPYPNGIIAPPGRSAGADTLIGLSPLLVEPFRKNAYVQQWNFIVSRQLHNNLVLDLAYTGNHGVRLPIRTFNINQIPREFLDYAHANFSNAVDVNGNRAANVSEFFNQQVANPFFGIITDPTLALRGRTISRVTLLRRYPQYNNPQLFNSHQGASKYHSFHARLQKRFSGGLAANMSYTWSKAMDLGASATNTGTVPGNTSAIDDIFDMQGQYAVSNYDVPHRFVAGFTYELPFGRKRRFGANWNGVVNGLLGGWQVSGTAAIQAGSPFAISANDFGLNYAVRRPNRLEGSARFDSDEARQRVREEKTWFNTSVFQSPGQFRLGNGARNYSDVRRDGYRNVDLSVLKNFYFADGRHKIQLRGEFINAFNIVVFGTPGTNVNDPASFGIVRTQGNTPRLIQLALRYTF